MTDIDAGRLRELPQKWREAAARLEAGARDMETERAFVLSREGRAGTFRGCAEELEAALPALLQLARAVNEAEQLLRKSAKEHEDAGDNREMDEASRNWHAGLSQAYEDGADMIRAAIGQTVALVPVPVKEG